MSKLHLQYFNKKVSDRSLNRINSTFYKKIIIERGIWLLALITEEIMPITEAQKTFLFEFKKLRSNDFDFNSIENENIKALILWKGENKIKGISMNLVHGKKKSGFKRRWKGGKGKFKAYGSLRRKKYSVESKKATAEEIEEIKNHKPPIKISKKNKLDPEKTRRMEDKGFHTREGSKSLNKGRFD